MKYGVSPDAQKDRVIVVEMRIVLVMGLSLWLCPFDFTLNPFFCS